MKCPNCQTENSERARFCQECGQALVLAQTASTQAIPSYVRPAAELLLRRFADCGLGTTGTIYPTCISRHLGAAAALLGRPEDARKHYDEALKVTAEIRFRPELALTRFQLAELLLEHYPEEKEDALDHLDFAIKEFREMKMQPSLERAQKLRS